MPGWLRALAHTNPLSYLVDGLRGVMLAGGASTLGLGRDVMVLAGGMAILVAVGGRMYPRLIT